LQNVIKVLGHMHFQIIHTFHKRYYASKMPKVDGDLLVQNCFKMSFIKFKVANNLSNLQIILTQTNLNILSTHCLQY